MSGSTADVVVVGGGVVGVACADAIAADGRSVRLVERAHLGSGTSGSCQSGIGYGLYMDDYDLTLSRAAVGAYERMAADVPEIGYTRDGAIFPAGDAEAGALRAAGEDLVSRGIPGRWLDRHDLDEVEPDLADWIVGGALLEEHGQGSPVLMIAALAKRAGGRGAVVEGNTEVLSLETRGDRVVGVTTSQGHIATSRVVIAAGVWSPQIVASVGVRLPVRPQKGHFLETEPTAGPPRHFIQDARYESVEASAQEATASESPAVTVLQHRPTGEVLIGSTRDFAGFEIDVDPERAREVATAAYDLMPALRDLAIRSRSTGLRPWSPDGRPLIGPMPGVDGLIIATGHGGGGNTLALLTGEIVAALIADRPSSVPIEPLSPGRFT